MTKNLQQRRLPRPCGILYMSDVGTPQGYRYRPVSVHMGHRGVFNACQIARESAHVHAWGLLDGPNYYVVYERGPKAAMYEHLTLN